MRKPIAGGAGTAGDLRVWGFELLVILGMILLNGVFAAYEIALASIPLSRLHRLDEEGRSGAKTALVMKRSMEGSLAVVQLGITLVGVIAAATGGAGAEEQIAPGIEAALGVSASASELVALALVVVPLTVVTIVFGELIPKVFALRNQEWVCLRLSPLMRWFSLAVHPVVWVLESSVMLLLRWGELLWKKRLEAHTKSEAAELQELRASVAIARTSRLIGAQEEKIILGATSFAQQPVREIMLPAEFISMLEVNSSLGEALVAAHLDMHTRFPASERAGNVQGIVGYVNFKDIVAHTRFGTGKESLRAIVRNIESFADDAPVSRCLQRLIQTHSHIALVRDSTRHVVGMVTMEDMIEELVGEIEDEYDRLPAHLVATGRGWIVGGGRTLDSLRGETTLDLKANAPESSASNVSEWIAEQMDGPIRGGEVIRRPTLRAVVRKIRRRKVLEAFLEPVQRDTPHGSGT